MPLKNASEWFLPSAVLLKELDFVPINLFHLEWSGDSIWTSSQADKNNAIVYSRGYIRIESKQAPFVQVVPIAAF